MASITVKFRSSTIDGREGTLYYRIIHQRQARRLSTSYRVFHSEWDERRGQVIVAKESERMTYILSVREGIHQDIERLYRIRENLDRKGIEFTADDIIEEFIRYTTDYTLMNFMNRIIARLKQNGHFRTSEAYACTLCSFMKFRSDEDIMLDCVTPRLMEDYEAWLRKNGLVPNTIGFYMRVLRAVYNRAVDDCIIEDRKPFRKVYTGVDKTIKRALPLQYIKKIKNMDLSEDPVLDYARDMFIMSFCLRGMSFVDMAYLKKTDIHNGILSYRRRKTGQRLDIAWETEMQTILDKYPENKTDYLLPIITNPRAEEHYAYRNRAYVINKSLKTIAFKAGLDVRLTLYVARHSWASVAKAQGIPVSVISEGMGHDSETTTRIYLASLDTSVIDKANSAILKSLRK